MYRCWSTAVNIYLTIILNFSSGLDGTGNTTIVQSPVRSWDNIKTNTPMKGPEFLKYVNPVLTALQSNGGAGDSSDIIQQVIDKLGITETELEETISNGQSRIRNQIQWARFYLFKAGFIDNSQRGIWRLTNEGLEKKLNDEDIYKLFRSVQDSVKRTPTTKPLKAEPRFENTPTEDEEHSLGLINIIQSFSASE
jgi:restriction system protein